MLEVGEQGGRDNSNTSDSNMTVNPTGRGERIGSSTKVYDLGR